MCIIPYSKCDIRFTIDYLQKHLYAHDFNIIITQAIYTADAQICHVSFTQIQTTWLQYILCVCFSRAFQTVWLTL